GLTEAYLQADGAPGAYTFWDYQAGAWQRNNGIRIDHALLSPQAADRLAGVSIHRDVRAWDKPSDHVPLVVELDVRSSRLADSRNPAYRRSMDEAARLFALLALVGGALTLAGAACLWFLDEGRRMRRTLAKALGVESQPLL